MFKGPTVSVRLWCVIRVRWHGLLVQPCNWACQVLAFVEDRGVFLHPNLPILLLVLLVFVAIVIFLCETTALCGRV